MQLLTLDANFQPTGLVENYSSLLWTERYSKSGDFQLVTNVIGPTMAALPLESVVTLRETTVPMVVEAYKIEKKLNSQAVLTITGRSYETVLERRASVGAPLPESYSELPVWKIQAIKPSDAAFIAIRTVIGDVAHDLADGSPAFGPVDPAVSPKDAIPELSLVVPSDYEIPTYVGMPPDWDSATSYLVGAVVLYSDAQWMAVADNTGVAPSLTTPEWKLNFANYSMDLAKPLYDSVTELLDSNNHAIKAVRPTSTGNTVSLEIYNGANLTGEGDTADPQHVVVFDARFDQFDDANYLLSKQGSTNVAYVFGQNGAQPVLKNTPDVDHPEPSGLNRRVISLNESSDASVNAPDVLQSRGLIELFNHNVVAMFDGQISVQIAQNFNNSGPNGYFLGDIVKLVGEYGLSEDVRVSEFIRSYDSSGEKAYPTLERVDT